MDGGQGGGGGGGGDGGDGGGGDGRERSTFVPTFWGSFQSADAARQFVLENDPDCSTLRNAAVVDGFDVLITETHQCRYKSYYKCRRRVRIERGSGRHTGLFVVYHDQHDHVHNITPAMVNPLKGLPLYMRQKCAQAMAISNCTPAELQKAASSSE